MTENDIAFMSASEIAVGIRRRQISPVEVMDATIARIERRNPTLNAFVYICFDDARRSAKKA